MKRFFSITNQLNDMFANTVSEFNSKKNAFDAIGTFCFSLVSSLNSWYRAQVLNWELVCVFLKKVALHLLPFFFLLGKQIG